STEPTSQPSGGGRHRTAVAPVGRTAARASSADANRSLTSCSRMAAIRASIKAPVPANYNAIVRPSRVDETEDGDTASLGIPSKRLKTIRTNTYIVKHSSANAGKPR